MRTAQQGTGVGEESVQRRQPLLDLAVEIDRPEVATRRLVVFPLRPQRVGMAEEEIAPTRVACCGMKEESRMHRSGAAPDDAAVVADLAFDARREAIFDRGRWRELPFKEIKTGFAEQIGIVLTADVVAD